MLVWTAAVLGVRGLRTRFTAVSPDSGVWSDKAEILAAASVRSAADGVREWVVG